MRVPIYLFQQGGVVPIETPLMRDTDLTPLIQTASMPVDSGVGTALQLRQQAFQREQFEYGKKQDALINNLKLIDIFERMTMNNMSTGVNSQGSRATGVPSNFHTSAQMAAMQGVENQRLSLVKNFFNGMNGNLMNLDPQDYFKLKEDIGRIEKNTYFDALEQAGFHQRQIDEFKKNGDKYDQELFHEGMTNYYNSSDIKEKHQMLHPDMEVMAQDAWKSVKDKWGLPGLMELQADGGSFYQAIQANPDIRGEFILNLEANHISTLQAKYDAYKKRDPQSQIDFGTWARAYTENMADRYLSPGIKTVGTPKELDGDTKSSGATSNVNFSNSANYAPAIAAKEGLSKADYVNKYEPVGYDIESLSQQGHIGYMEHSLGPTEGHASKKIIPEGEMGNFEDVVEFQTGKTDTSEYLTPDRELTREGELLLKEYNKNRNEEIRQPLVILGFQDENLKDDVYTTGTTRNKVLNQIVTGGSTVQLMDIDTGEMLDGSEFSAQHGGKNSLLSSGEGSQVSANVVGYVDIRNPIGRGHHVNRKGDVLDVTGFGAEPYYLEVETIEDDGEGNKVTATKRYAVRRDADWLQKNPEKVAGNKLYQDALLRRGMSVKDTDNTLNLMLSNQNIDPERREGIAKGTTDVRYSKDNGGTLTMKYGRDNDRLANVNVSVNNPEILGSTLNLVDAIANDLGEGHNVDVQQLKPPGLEGTAVRITIDGNNSIDTYLNDGELPRIKALVESIKEEDKQGDFDASNISKEQYLEMVSDFAGEDVIKEKLELLDSLATASATEIPGIIDSLKQPVEYQKGRANAKAYFKNAQYTNDANLDMNLSKRFIHDWTTRMDPLLPGYMITSGYRAGDSSDAGIGESIDLTGRDPILNEWMKDNVPGLTKTNGTAVKHYQIPNTPFAVAYHQNMKVIRNATGRVIKKVPTNGWHYDIKYASSVTVQPIE